MGNSSSLPDLAEAGFLSQSRGHSDPSRMSALLAAESVASCNLSAGALCSAPPHSTLIIMRRPVSMMRDSRSLDPWESDPEQSESKHLCQPRYHRHRL